RSIGWPPPPGAAFGTPPSSRPPEPSTAAQIAPALLGVTAHNWRGRTAGTPPLGVGISSPKPAPEESPSLAADAPGPSPTVRTAPAFLHSAYSVVLGAVL